MKNRIATNSPGEGQKNIYEIQEKTRERERENQNFIEISIFGIAKTK